MRAIVIFLIGTIAFAIPSYSQEPKLRNQDAFFPLMNQGYGGFGGPQFKITSVNGEASMIGGGPLFLVVHPELKWYTSFSYLEGEADSVGLWYFGFGGEYTVFLSSILELNLNGQIGLGRANQNLPTQRLAATLYIIEPEITAATKIMQFERLKLGFGYRCALPSSPTGQLTRKKLSGFYGVVYLAYGIFDIERRSQYLAGNKRKSYLSGTYSMKFTRLNGQFAILDGGGTRFFFSRKFAIGASGYRTLRPVDYKGNDFSIIYGGVWLYYPMEMLNRVHLSFGALLGYGGVGYVRKGTNDIVGKGMPVIDPDVFLNVNLTEFMQVGIGLGYRFSLTSFEDVDLFGISGPTTTLQVRFGAF